VTVEATSGRQITVETLEMNTGVFHDREYNFDSLGHFVGKTFIKYSNDDKTTDYDKVMTKLRTLEPATVFTLLDSSNYFPLLAVTDSEWLWIMENVPKAPHAFGTAERPAVVPPPSQDPCAPQTDVKPPQETFPKVYGSLVTDRVGVAIPEFTDGAGLKQTCSSYETKVCHRANLLSAANAPAKVMVYNTCHAVYDCAEDDVWYAVAATFLAFLILHPVACCMPLDGSCCGCRPQPTIVKKVYDVGPPESLFYTLGCFLFTTLFWTVFSYLLVNMVNYFFVVQTLQKEMCMKVFDWQTNNKTAEEGRMYFSLLETIKGNGDKPYDCHNESSYFRLVPLMICTWLTLYVFFFIWRNRMVKQGEDLRGENKDMPLD